jgi:hypothetical protein
MTLTVRDCPISGVIVTSVGSTPDSDYLINKNNMPVSTVANMGIPVYTI